MTNKNTRLGNNPLDWIGKETKDLKSKKIRNDVETRQEEREKRETFIVKVSLSEKIKDYAYWERKKQKDTLNYILEEFFKNNPTKKRPEVE
jgi:hypothetical protein|tara:strand:+ start:2953 stop:3225 length:273 start_codon:yes stop_codon:yes gene_type:complete